MSQNHHRTGQMMPFREVRQASHYPAVDRAVVAVAKKFPAKTRTGRHLHERAQLLHAVNGLMVAATDAGTWIVPERHALWLPANLIHDVSMHGNVVMCTAYIRDIDAARLHQTCRVLTVSPLLEASLVELSAEEPAYCADERGSHLAWLILDEIRHARSAPFVLPFPHDPRLVKLSRAVIASPGSTRTIDDWCHEFGLSRRTLTRSFRKETGLSFGAWRRRLCVLVAAERFAEGETLARVAAQFGYESAAAFRSMAIREFGGALPWDGFLARVEPGKP